MVFMDIISDRVKRNVDHFPAQKHKDLSRNDNVAAPFAAGEIAGLDMEMFGYDVHDQLRGNLSFFLRRNNVTNCFFSKFDTDLFIVDPLVGDQFV